MDIEGDDLGINSLAQSAAFDALTGGSGPIEGLDRQYVLVEQWLLDPSTVTSANINDWLWEIRALQANYPEQRSDALKVVAASEGIPIIDESHSAIPENDSMITNGLAIKVMELRAGDIFGQSLLLGNLEVTRVPEHARRNMELHLAIFTEFYRKCEEYLVAFPDKISGRDITLLRAANNLVGPQTGALTEAFVERVTRVDAVEKEVLARQFAENVRQRRQEIVDSVALNLDEILEGWLIDPPATLEDNDFTGWLEGVVARVETAELSTNQLQLEESEEIAGDLYHFVGDVLSGIDDVEPFKQRLISMIVADMRSGAGLRYSAARNYIGRLPIDGNLRQSILARLMD